MKMRHCKTTKLKRRNESTTARGRGPSPADMQEQLDRLTRELVEAREQQSATSKVLQVISSSPTELEPVFQVMLANAVHVCEAKLGSLFLCDGDLLRRVAGYNVPSEMLADLRKLNPCIYRVDQGTVMARAVRTKQIVHIPDIKKQSFLDESVRAVLEKYGLQTVLGVPLLQEKAVLGVIMIHRKEVRPFSDRQIELVKNFAHQAVIAIENVRLLNELRQRTADLREAHDRVTAQAADLETWNRTLEQRVAEQVAEIERVGRLKSFLPPQIAQLVVSAGHESVLESHRRDVSVVFCDLRGFTAFSELAEPEEVMLVLREYQTKLGVLINKFEGTVERFSGDGLLVVFNDPLPCPDASMRAVQMALEMRDEVAKLSVKWSHSGHDIGFGVGIAHGYATLGSIGYEGRLQYSVTGKVANLASRLCDQAKDGQILVDVNVFSAVETLADVEFAGELALKGFSRPVKAFNVCNLRSPQS
jgi:class 3 adenylate cyclase